MNQKPKIMISFSEGGENGGPFISHKRIMESTLNEKYHFVPLIVPKGRIGLFNIKLIVTLVRELRQEKPDIVHFDGLQLKGFHIALACKFAGIKNSVLAIHGSSLEAINFSSWKKNIINILEIATLKLSKVCYGVSEYVSNWKRVKKYSRWCYGHIYNMPDVKKSEVENDTPFRRELGFSKDDVLIVSTGRITREKGYDILLDVIKQLAPPHNIKFVIAGDGGYLETFRNEVENNKLKESVFLLGYRNDINNILSESDVFVICTLHETLCISILEACYNSLPVVATNVGGIPEIIENGKSGYLIKENDVNSFVTALTKFIEDSKERRKMGAHGREVVNEKFSKEKIISQIDDLYQKVLTR